MLKVIKHWWYTGDGNNAGDVFSPWLFKQMGYESELDESKPLITCGSIMTRGTENSIVWGSGVHRADETDYIKIKPENVLAVRGELSKEIVCPEKDVVLGDPGILLSRYYNPNKPRKYKFGIISHWVDYSKLSRVCKARNVRLINMRHDWDKRLIEDVADAISECEFIFSSSLHGIIFAHSLGVPAVHLEVSELYSKGNFKFKDYYSVYSSVKYEKIKWNSNLEFVKKYLSHKEDYLPSKEEVENIQDRLLEVFPYDKL